MPENKKKLDEITFNAKNEKVSYKNNFINKMTSKKAENPVKTNYSTFIIKTLTSTIESTTTPLTPTAAPLTSTTPITIEKTHKQHDCLIELNKLEFNQCYFLKKNNDYFLSANIDQFLSPINIDQRFLERINSFELIKLVDNEFMAVKLRENVDLNFIKVN